MITNGFLLGAGASFELGMPLVDELSITFKKALLRNINGKYYDCPDRLKTLAESLLRDDSLNYEEIIGRIEIEYQRNRSSDLHQEWHWLLGRYNEAIYFLLLEYHERNINYIKERLNLLSSISKYSIESPLWVFSLNHDLLFEMICKYLELPVKYGFYDKISINGLSFEKLSRENIELNQFSFFQNCRGVNLIKLHGALDLFVQGNKKDYIKLVNENSWEGIINDISSLIKNDAATKNYGGRIANEITYNDNEGVLQFLRMSIMSGKHKYSNRIQHNLDNWFLKIFQGHINNVNHLYCIGYSFGDIHINSVLGEWLSFSENRKIIIVDPNIKGIPIDFKHLKEQFEIKKMGFLEFLNHDSDKKTISKIKLFEKARKFSRGVNTNKKGNWE